MSARRWPPCAADVAPDLGGLSERELTSRILDLHLFLRMVDAPALVYMAERLLRAHLGELRDRLQPD